MLRKPDFLLLVASSISEVHMESELVAIGRECGQLFELSVIDWDTVCILVALVLKDSHGFALGSR